MPRRVRPGLKTSSMVRRRSPQDWLEPPSTGAVAGQVLDVDTPEASILDLLDRLLDKGVMADGDVTLGVAGVDLIYVRLAALLCAADRVLPRNPLVSKKKSRHRPAFAQWRASATPRLSVDEDNRRGGGQPVPRSIRKRR